MQQKHFYLNFEMYKLNYILMSYLKCYVKKQKCKFYNFLALVITKMYYYLEPTKY